MVVDEVAVAECDDDKQEEEEEEEENNWTRSMRLSLLGSAKGKEDITIEFEMEQFGKT